MRLTAWEEERLLLFAAAELARQRRARGLRLNAPETVALICHEMFEAARGGAYHDAVVAAGLGAVAPDEVLDGVRELVDEIRLEVLLGDGTRLVVLVDPLGAGRPLATDGPGSILPAASPRAADAPDARERVRLVVRNESQRAIRVSSHVRFERVNARLAFDRSAAAGFHLDVPAGSSERWAPGEQKPVDLVRFAGGADGPDGEDRG
jgi:urease subunit gamma/beta